MLTDYVKKHLTDTADRHDEVAAVYLAPMNHERAAHHQQQADQLVASAERIAMEERAPFVTRARQHELLATAYRSHPDQKMAATYAQTAEDLRAIVEDRLSESMNNERVSAKFAPPAAAVEKEHVAGAHDEPSNEPAGDPLTDVERSRPTDEPVTLEADPQDEVEPPEGRRRARTQG